MESEQHWALELVATITVITASDLDKSLKQHFDYVCELRFSKALAPGCQRGLAILEIDVPVLQSLNDFVEGYLVIVER